MKTLNDAKKYVGGNWEEIGEKVFTLLKEEGLKPRHRLLDIGCGALRCGRLLIPYLKKGRYIGLEQHEWLINEGIRMIGMQTMEEKNVMLLINKDFNLSLIKRKVRYVIAKSVFTHLTKDKIKQCLDNLKPVIKKDGAFYASIFIGDSVRNLKESDDNKKFSYSIKEIQELAYGWEIESLGHRGCKRQTMLKLTLK